MLPALLVIPSRLPTRSEDDGEDVDGDCGNASSDADADDADGDGDTLSRIVSYFASHYSSSTLDCEAVVTKN